MGPRGSCGASVVPREGDGCQAVPARAAFVLPAAEQAGPGTGGVRAPLTGEMSTEQPRWVAGITGWMCPQLSDLLRWSKAETERV